MIINARMGFTLSHLSSAVFLAHNAATDSKDETAEECGSYGKKCKVRSAPCTNTVPTTASQTTTDGKKPVTVLQIAHPRREITKGTSSVPLSWPAIHCKADGGIAMDSRESNTQESRALVILAIGGAALAIWVCSFLYYDYLLTIPVDIPVTKIRMMLMSMIW